MDRNNQTAQEIRKLIREAEGVTDETIAAVSKLKQAMVTARRGPGIHPATGHKALTFLTQAEKELNTVYGNLLRVHSELSDVAVEVGISDDGTKTDFTGKAVLIDA
ncbi:MAG: hypothetical protein WA842_06285 [Croceibacterium sp.]